MGVKSAQRWSLLELLAGRFLILISQAMIVTATDCTSDPNNWQTWHGVMAAPVLAFDPVSGNLLSGNSDNNPTLWDISTGEIIWNVSIINNSELSSVVGSNQPRWRTCCLREPRLTDTVEHEYPYPNSHSC